MTNSFQEWIGGRCPELSLLFVVDVACCFGVMPRIGTPCDYEEAYEERDGGNGEYGDGSTQTCAYLGRGACGGVAAHAAALGVGGWCAA